MPRSPGDPIRVELTKWGDLAHWVAYGYPAEIIALAEATKRTILAAVTERTVPFDGTADQWLARLRDLLEPRHE